MLVEVGKLMNASYVSALTAFTPLTTALHQWESTTSKSASGTGANWLDVVGGLDLVPDGSNTPTLVGDANSPNAAFDLSDDYWQSDVALLGSGSILEDIHKGTNDFTINIIARLDGQSGNEWLLDTRGDPVASAGLTIYDPSSAGGGFHLRMRGDSGWITDTSASTNFIPSLETADTNPWVMYTWSFDASATTMRFWRNGKLIRTDSSFSTGTTPDNLGASDKLVIGANGALVSELTSIQIKSIMIDDQARTSITDIVDYYTALHTAIVADPDYYVQKPYYGDTTRPVVAAGQSLIARLLTISDARGQRAYDSGIAAYDPRLSMKNVAISGSALLKSNDTGTGHWVDDDSTLAEGDLYDQLEMHPELDTIVWKQGSSEVVAGESEADYNAGLDALLGFIDSDFSNFERMIVCPWHRRTDVAIGNTIPIINGNSDFVADNAKAVWGPDTYDLGLTDQVHFTAGEFEVFGERLAEYVAGYAGERDVPEPVSISSASIAGSTITVELDLGDATDITIETDAHLSFLYVDDTDGNMSPTAISKTDSDTFTLTLGATPSAGTGTLYVIDNGLSDTDPEVVRGNDPLGLPLFSGAPTVIS